MGSNDPDNAHMASSWGGVPNVSPLWGVLDRMVPPKPGPISAVTTWPYEVIRPALIESGSLVSAEEAERRVLMLVDPTLGAPYTTDSIYAGLQLILPGETAPAHRHVAFALRFIVEGHDGFTAVQGEKVMMSRGDVILTPTWTWHDHGNEGSGPMIWLDGLDLPVFRFLAVNFAENYTDASRFPSQPAQHDTCNKIPWTSVAKELDEEMDHKSYARYDYHLRRKSDLKQPKEHLSRTISAQAERIAAGCTSPESQETCSFVYHIYEGEGYTTIITPAGQTEVVSWQARDTFSIPAWSVLSHTCTMDNGQAYLFAINDRPMIEALGLMRAK